MSAPMPEWVEHVRDACTSGADWEDDLPSAAELADDAPITPDERWAFLRSLSPTARVEHVDNLRAWHTPGSGPDPLEPMLAAAERLDRA